MLELYPQGLEIAIKAEHAMQRLEDAANCDGAREVKLDDIITMFKFNSLMFDMLTDTITKSRQIAEEREKEQEEKFRRTRADLEVLFVRDQRKKYEKIFGRREA